MHLHCAWGSLQRWIGARFANAHVRSLIPEGGEGLSTKARSRFCIIAKRSPSQGHQVQTAPPRYTVTEGGCCQHRGLAANPSHAAPRSALRRPSHQPPHRKTVWSTHFVVLNTRCICNKTQSNQRTPTCTLNQRFQEAFGVRCWHSGRGQAKCKYL